MYNVKKFNLGRNALKYIVEYYDIKELHIPYYLCDVIRHTLVDINCKPLFYHIDDNFYPFGNFNSKDFILYPNYFGIFRENVKKLSKTYPNLIVDNAHAYFDKPMGLASFNAGHKFGFKYSYAFLKENNANLSTELLNQKQINIRRNKFILLHNKYKNINLLNIDLNSIPFCYPCLVDTEINADNLVNQLNNEGMIIYRYWNNLPKTFNEYKFYSRLVPIPI